MGKRKVDGRRGEAGLDRRCGPKCRSSPLHTSLPCLQQPLPDTGKAGLCDAPPPLPTLPATPLRSTTQARWGPTAAPPRPSHLSFAPSPLPETGDVGPDGADVSLRSVGPASLGDAAGISSAYIPYKWVASVCGGRGAIGCEERGEGICSRHQLCLHLLSALLTAV